MYSEEEDDIVIGEAAADTSDRIAASTVCFAGREWMHTYRQVM